ncbi:hypothetical protein, partial [Owenweeksia hongkongensis]|uniref:hypothetical protein n=1 Tax=Owenweeksia hongkongensis TaxID=253245 RepID=UPI003A90F390
MKNLFRILIVTMISLMAFQSRASHLLGGEIIWECTANGKYDFTMIVYRECGAGAIPLPGNQTINGPVNIPMTRQSIVEVSPVCLGGGSISCNTSPSGKGAVEKHTFKSNSPVTLSGVPPAGGWIFSWFQSARPGTVVNITPGNYFLRAIMYPYQPVGATAPLNSNPCYDNSPKFQELGSITICTGSPFTYNHLVADKDLDSLFVRFAEPWTAANTPVNWDPGYSFQSPYPSNLTNPANGPVVLNSKTGEISMDIQVAQDGSYASCYEVEAWKCGVDGNGVIRPIKVASVFRDVVIITANGCATNNEPSAFIDTSTYRNIKQLGPKTYKTSVYPGDTINFRLSATDTDINPSTFLPQQITFQAAGLEVSRPMASGTG